MDDMETRFAALLDTLHFGTSELSVLTGACERTIQRWLRKRDPKHRGPWRFTRRELLAKARAFEADMTPS